MSTRHTSGPWSIERKDNDMSIPDFSIRMGHFDIAVFPYKRVYSEDRSQSGLVIDDELMSNARLIAAAPDLLEALERLMVECDLVSEDAVKAYANARAVIAKATGEKND